MRQPAGAGAGAVPWLVSGRTAAALRGAGGAAGRARWRPARSLDPADVAWSLATTRSAFEHRAVVTGASREELAAGLAAVAAGRAGAPGVVTGAVAAGGAGRVVFVFPGQGGQWAGMGRELARPARCSPRGWPSARAALAPHVDWDLDEVLAGAPGAPAWTGSTWSSRRCGR